MQNEFSVAVHWSGGFDETGLETWARELRRRLGSRPVSLGLIFMSPQFFPHAEQVLEIVRVHAETPLLAGCSSSGLIARADEMENDSGLVLGLFSLPGAILSGIRFSQEQVEEANGPGYWHLETGIQPEGTNGLLAFVDPFQTDAERWLRGWNEAYASIPIVGGLASGGSSETERMTQVYLNGEAFPEGGVAIALRGEVGLAGVISQGCTPIGQSWTITRVDENRIHEIGNRPAYEVLVDTVNSLSAGERQRAQGNLFVGFAVNEYLDDFHRGDFLIRNLTGVDPRSGIIAVGAYPRSGQTIQFQCRDATAATKDMEVMLARARKQLDPGKILGGCLCVCNGRGQYLFGRPSHDAEMVQQCLGPFGLAGFFCNGEIGPVGNRNYLHGFTASLALFVKA